MRLQINSFGGQATPWVATHRHYHSTKVSEGDGQSMQHAIQGYRMKLLISEAACTWQGSTVPHVPNMAHQPLVRTPANPAACSLEHRPAGGAPS